MWTVLIEPLRITTLGSLIINKAEQPVKGFISRKVEALLVYLAANPREHPREILGELLWDDLPQERTAANLRTALSSLQQQLAPYLIITRQTLAINPESPFLLDVTQLDRALDAADRLWAASGRFSRADSDHISEALDLYRGAFLEGFHVREARVFEGWKLLEQERIRYRVMQMVYRLAENALQRGWHTLGIAFANRALQFDPLWEEAHRLLMRLLANAGQRAAALAQYESCQRSLKEQLGIEPSNETFDLYCEIDDGKIEVSQSESTFSNLPPLTQIFVERPGELNSIITMLRNPACRLLTLLGMGGTGKTRLAIEAARRQIGLFPQGVCFVPLDTQSGPLAEAILASLGIAAAADVSAVAALAAYLHEREMLIVLDSFEHALDSTLLISELLAAAPCLKIMVTSTVRLHLREEWLLPIGGLHVPPTHNSDDTASYPAVQLYLEYARKVNPVFTLDGHEHDIADLCRLVEGLPLALELAAHWTQLLPTADITQQVASNLGFLTSRYHNMPERHRSLHALFQQTLTRLSDDEQAALLRLAALPGGFDVAQANARGVSLLTIATLVDQSLLRVQASGTYDFHPLIRRYLHEPSIS